MAGHSSAPQRSDARQGNCGTCSRLQIRQHNSAPLPSLAVRVLSRGYRRADTGRGPIVWAQMISTRLKPGREDDLQRLVEQIEAAEQPGSGLVRSTAMRDQNDPTRIHMLVVFDSEEAARAREADPRRQEGLGAARELMAEIFDGPPEFVDLEVLHEH